MRNILLFLLLLIFSVNISYAQNNPYVTPLIKNYSIKEYKAGTANWCIVKDKRGILYFGNDEGVLEYDGLNWNLIKIDAITRSLAIDSSGIIYVGADNDFGYIKADKIGNMYYTSLSDSLNENLKDFSDISNIFTTDQGVYFINKKKIYKYHKGEISVIPLNKGGFTSFYINNTLFSGDYYIGLQKIVNDSLILCKNSSSLIGKDIIGMIQYGERKLLISTQASELYIYNPETGVLYKPDFPDFPILESLIKESKLYLNSVTKLKNGYLINTLYNGIILIDDNFKLTGHYNNKTSLIDKPVLNNYSPYTKSEEPTWLALSNGISKIELNTPIQIISEKSGLPDEINDIIRFNNELYFASVNGVYKLQYNKNLDNYKYKVIDKTDQKQCWSFFNIEDKLIATSYFLFNITESPVSISRVNDHIYKLITYKNSVYAAEVDGLTEYEFDGNEFTLKNRIKEVKDEIIYFDSDSDENLWLLSNKNDLIRFKINKNDTIVEYINETKGLNKTDNLFFFNYSGSFYVSTDKDLLRYDNKQKKLVKENELNKELHNILVSINVFETSKTGDIYISKHYGNFDKIIKIRIRKNDDLEIDSVTFKRLPQMNERFIYPDTGGLVWISTSEGLYVYDSNTEFRPNKKFKTIIRKVKNKNSLIFNGTYFTNGKLVINQPESYIPTFNYQNNSIIFYYASPYFIEEKATEYYTFLEGFDQEWSNASKISFKEYTNLHEGSYTFKVKAKNIYGIESETAEYSFKILPPWYRTVWAYITYFILSVLFVWLVVKLNTRRLQKDKERLEGIVKERTAEIVQQKEEIETIADNLQVANEEISSKNVLLKQKNESITSSIEYASRIQRALLPPNEIIKKYLPDYFIFFKPRDIVSGDFYWFKQIGNYTVYAAADCTGHGVPGAFMSMLGISFLNEIVNDEEVNKPSQVLDKLRDKVKLSLRQTGKDNESKDGMDIAVCVIDNENLTVEFAGAYNPLYIIRKGELHEIKATRNPIGIYLKEKPFENHKFQLEKGDVLYTFSDGYVDQFGGEDDGKFKAKNFKKLLLKISDKPMDKQKEILDGMLLQWQGETEQTDDIIVFGVRI